MISIGAGAARQRATKTGEKIFRNAYNSEAFAMNKRQTILNLVPDITNPLQNPKQTTEEDFLDAAVIGTMVFNYRTAGEIPNFGK